jgi:formylglycine-generating enzyme required for sulfatase activity
MAEPDDRPAPESADDEDETPEGSWHDTSFLNLLRQALHHRGLTPALPGGAAPADPGQPTSPPVGPTLGRFLIRRELGRGGFGVVFLAYDPELGREVALKVPQSEGILTPELRARFRREAVAGAGLDHPNLVPVHDAGTAGPVCFLVSAYCPGPTLAAWLRERTEPVPPRLAARLLATLAEAVEAAHRHHVIHRDLKPGNVLLSPLPPAPAEAAGADALPFQPRITDFGLAKLLEGGPAALAADPPTCSGALLGTPQYMAPEQAAGHARDVGPATDIFALGVMLYEVLTGRPPFQGETTFETLQQICHDEPVAPGLLRPKLPRDLETICLTCLRKEPARRYRSAAALAADLNRFLAGEPIAARPPTAWERGRLWVKRRPTTAALLGVCVLALCGMLAAAGWYRQRAHALHGAALVQSLATANTADVPSLVRQLDGYRPWADPLLKDLLAESPPGSTKRLHASLALLPTDAGQVEHLFGHLLRAAAPEFVVLRDALHPHRDQLRPRLWRVLEDEDASPEARFRAAAALADYAPDDPRWARYAPATADWLVAENPLAVGTWAEALRPVRSALLPPLSGIFRQAVRPDGERVAAAAVLGAYADRPEFLVELLLDAEARQMTVVLNALGARRDRAVVLLRRELDGTVAPVWPDAPLDPSWPEPDAALSARVREAQGLLTERFALCQILPLDGLDEVAAGLGRSGYRLLCCRPYPAGGSVCVAAVWQRDGRDARWVHGLSAEELSRRDALWQKQGYVPADVAGYLTAAGERYAAVWVKPREAGEGGRLVVGEASPADAGTLAFPKEPFGCARSQPFTGAAGQTRFNSVLRQPGVSGFRLWQMKPADYARHVRHLSLNFVQADVGINGPAAAEDEPRYSAVWHAGSDRVAQEMHGLDPGDHMRQARLWAAQGFRPVAVAVAGRGAGPPRWAASVWHRPVIPDAARDALAKRQAQAAVALLRLGEGEPVWPLLKHDADPRRRTYLMLRLGLLGADPQALVRRLRTEPDATVRQALILGLGEFGDARLPDKARRPVRDWLLGCFRTDSDPGVHGAADWLLRRWGDGPELERIDRELAHGKPDPGRRWFVNGQGQTFAVVAGPAEFLMGAPWFEPHRQAREYLHHRRISRSFAVAAREVTVEQFRRFLRDHPEAKPASAGRYTKDPRGPMVGMTWYQAAMYCRWLSEKEGVPEGQMCFPPVADIKPGMRLPADVLAREGYRLPTEAEWEYACRAGTTSSRSYGAADDLLGKFAWSIRDAKESPLPVGRLRPNALGLFDMLGNAAEWCLGREAPYRPDLNLWALEDSLDEAGPAGSENRIIRGGAWVLPAFTSRSAFRLGQNPLSNNPVIGLRPVRTYRGK